HAVRLGDAARRPPARPATVRSPGDDLLDRAPASPPPRIVLPTVLKSRRPQMNADERKFQLRSREFVFPSIRVYWRLCSVTDGLGRPFYQRGYFFFFAFALSFALSFGIGSPESTLTSRSSAWFASSSNLNCPRKLIPSRAGASLASAPSTQHST